MCCRYGSGLFLPRDVPGPRPLTVESLREFCRERKTVVYAEYIYGYYSKPQLMLRPRQADACTLDQCVHLTASGCALGDLRPTGCKSLEVIRADRCVQRMGTSGDGVFAARSWRRYQPQLRELAKEDGFSW